MNQTLKIIVPIVALMAVVFGITFISVHNPEDPKTTTKGIDETGPGETLRFYSSVRKWDAPVLSAENVEYMGQYDDPLTLQHIRRGPFYGFPLLAPSLAIDPKEANPFLFNLQNRTFPGFYEPSADASGPKNGAAFWFENRNKESVTIELKEVSCGACSGGRVAPIPPEVARQMLEMMAVSILPQGLVTGLPAGLAGPAANLATDRLKWVQHSFLENRHATYKVQGSTNSDGWSPQWGILELQFSVGKEEQKTLTADFALQVDGTKQFSTNRFSIAFYGAEPFDILNPTFNVGTLSNDSDTKTGDIILYSCTRGANGSALGDLAPPNILVEMGNKAPGDPGPFVSVGTPVRIPDGELAGLNELVNLEFKKPAKIIAAYKFPLTVAPKVGDKRIDIGPLERDVWVSFTNVPPKAVMVRGMVQGDVSLDNKQTHIDLGNYATRNDYSQKIRLLTAKPDIELALVPDQCKPDFLKAALEKAPSGDRGGYDLNLTIPKDGTLARWSGEIVLEIQGPNPQRIRFRIQGNPQR